MERNNIINNLFFIACIILFISLSFAILGYVDEISKSNSQNRTISFQGEGKVTMTPDIASFKLTISETEFELKKARDTVSSAAQKIYEYLDEQGIEENDIKTLNYQIHPEYEYVRTKGISERVFKGYKVTHTTQIKVRDLDKLETVLARVSVGDTTNVDNLSFTVDEKDLKQFKNDALALAIKDADKVAEDVAGQTDISLGNIVSVQIQGNPNYYPKSNYDSSYVSLSSSSRSESIPISTGENDVTVNVTVIYQLD